MAIKKTRTRVREHIDCSGDTPTIQSEREKTNIHAIMAKYQRSGLLPEVQAKPMVADLSHGIDFREAMQRVADAKSEFERLPAKLRKEFDHDPAKMVDFVQTAEKKQLVELGLAEWTEAEIQEMNNPEEQHVLPETSGETSEPTQ